MTEWYKMDSKEAEKLFKEKFPRLYEKYENEYESGDLNILDIMEFAYNEGEKDAADKLRSYYEIKTQKADELKKEGYIESMQLNEGIQAIAEEHNDLVSSPTALASNLAGLGFKGTIVREQPLYNTLVTDQGTVGTYTETIKIG